MNYGATIFAAVEQCSSVCTDLTAYVLSCLALNCRKLSTYFVRVFMQSSTLKPALYLSMSERSKQLEVMGVQAIGSSEKPNCMYIY